MKMSRIAAVLAVAASVSWSAPAGSQTLGLYDDFQSGRLDPSRWLGYEYSIDKYESRPEALYGTPDWDGGPNNPSNVNSVRRVVVGQAQIAVTSHLGPAGAFYGYGAKARSGLRVNHAALADHRPAVTAFQATVTVARASVPTVPVDMSCYYSDVGTARAELVGHFFNDGTSTRPDDLRGDVFVILALVRRVERTDAGEVVINVLEAGIGRCAEPDCSRVRGGRTGRISDRTWRIGVPYVLTMAWDAASSAFMFTVADGATTESYTMTYTGDTFPVRGYTYDLRVENRARRCYTDPSRSYTQVPQQVSIDARFDDVQLNRAAATATR